MARRSVHHRIYTHAPIAANLTGGRIRPLGELDAEPILAPFQLAALNALMESILPLGDKRAYALRRLSAGEGAPPYICFIVSHPTADAVQRLGGFTHARIVETTPHEAGMEIIPLLYSAASFEPQPPLERISASIEREKVIEVPDWSTDAIRADDDEWIANVLALCLAHFRGSSTVVGIISEFSGLELFGKLAAAWSILPVGMQRTLSIALDATPGTRATVIFQDKPGAEPQTDPVRQEWITFYVTWMLAHPQHARSFIESDGVTDPGTLQTAFDEYVRNADVGETRNMATRNQSRDENKRGGGSGNAPQSVEHLNEQMQAVEASIRDAVNRRLDAIQATLERQLQNSSPPSVVPPPRATDSSSPPPEVPGGVLQPNVPPAPRRPWPSATTIGVVTFVIILLLLLFLQSYFLWMRHGDSIAEQQSREQRLLRIEKRLGLKPLPRTDGVQDLQAEKERPSPIDLKVVPPTASGFVTLTQKYKPQLAAAIEAVQADERVHPDIPKNTQDHLVRIRGLLEKGTVLGDTDRQRLRSILFEYVATELLKRDRDMQLPGFVLDGATDDVDQKILDKLHSANINAAITDEPDFHAEVVMRWMAKLR